MSIHTHRMIQLCIVVLVLCVAQAQFPEPVLPPALPMDLYAVQGSGDGDLSCGLDFTQLTLQRQFTIGQYSSLKEAPSFEAFDTGMRKIWDSEDETIRVIVPAAGVYMGIEEVIEYITLVVGSVNDGYAYYYNATISNVQYFPSNSSISFQVAQKAKFFCNSPPSNIDPGDCQTDEMSSLSLHHVSFKPCTALIKQYVVAYDDVQNYMATKGARAVTVCSRHNQYCTGENRQFADFMECMQYMESIPFTTCGTEVFNGNNMLCRFKHSFMVRFRPELHCPHVGKHSVPCTDVDCGRDFSCQAKPGDLTYSPRLHPRCCSEKSRGKRGKAMESRCAVGFPRGTLYN